MADDNERQKTLLSILSDMVDYESDSEAVTKEENAKVEAANKTEEPIDTEPDEQKPALPKVSSPKKLESSSETPPTEATTSKQPVMEIKQEIDTIEPESHIDDMLADVGRWTVDEEYFEQREAVEFRARAVFGTECEP